MTRLVRSLPICLPIWLPICLPIWLAALPGCAPAQPTDDLADEPDVAERASAATTGALELNFLYIHGVENDAGSRSRAHNTLNDLKAAVAADLPALISTYQASHPGVTVRFASASANLYTATPSGIHPSDSTDPTLMDDWEVGDPGCSSTRQGDPCTTAYEWRFRLVQEIKRLFPATAKNLILIGHSTGARTAFEIASNTGPGGVGTFDWGVQDRIAAVVSINGVIDGLQTSKYNVVGAASFVTTCKDSDAIASVFGAGVPGNGWCEYAGNVTGIPAADWVGQHKRSRVLISTASCSPSLWTGNGDGSLPFAAEGSPFSVGLNTTPATGQTFTVAYGKSYGAFCHSTITSGSDANHAAAVASAKANIEDLIFTAATRVDQQGSTSTPASVPFHGSSPTFSIGGACPAGDAAINPHAQVVGVCKHPGLFDGDDHAIAGGELTVSNAAACAATFKWTQNHDSNNSHSATFWWQTRSTPAGGGLLSILPPS
jgi:pimeloyl-ACP methyl ester carboxylesterase